MKLQDVGCVSAFVGYSTGLGQILAIPGAIVSAVSAGVFGTIELTYHCKAKMAAKTPDKQKTFTAKKVQAKNRAVISVAASVFFLLGAIPFAGAFIGILAAGKITGNGQSKAKA